MIFLTQQKIIAATIDPNFVCFLTRGKANFLMVCSGGGGRKDCFINPFFGHTQRHRQTLTLTPTLTHPTQPEIEPLQRVILRQQTRDRGGALRAEVIRGDGQRLQTRRRNGRL